MRGFKIHGTISSLVERCFTSELRQGRNFAWVVVGRQAVKLYFLAHDVFLRLVGRPPLVTWSVENDEGKNINVPHPVNTGEESRREFQLNVIPLPPRFTDLSENKADDGQESAE